MKKLSALVLATALASTAAFAGGPIVVADEGEPVAVVAAPASSINAGIVIPLLLLILLGLALANNDGPAPPE